jgi:hypothetical protein
MRAKPTHAVVTVFLRSVHKLPHPFPIDMLRYDNCTPRTEQEANKIAASQRHELRDERPIIAVNHYYPTPGHPRITAGRWRSFGWEPMPAAEVEKLVGPLDYEQQIAHWEGS